MAAKDISQLDFESILKRGSATEPRNFRPVPRISKEEDLSLNSAVRNNQKNINNAIPNGAAATEPQNKKKNRKKMHGDESGFSSDGSQSLSRKRTPMTLPRTKVTSATPLEQKIALKRLKQKLNFGEQNEAKPSSMHMNGDMSDHLESVASSVITTENEESEVSEIDTKKLDERLDQVRDYIKQATGMYLSLSMSMQNEDPKKPEQLGKLSKLIQQLRIQEKGYVDLLDKTQESEIALKASQNNDSQTGPTENSELVAKQHELEHLREQQALLKKIVEQQNTLKALKDRQSTLLAMQENHEDLIREHRKLESLKNEMGEVQGDATESQEDETQSEVSSNVSSSNLSTSNNTTDTEGDDNDDDDDEANETNQKRLQLEEKLKSLNEKKRQMDQLMSTLQKLKQSHTAESNMTPVLNDDDLSEVASEFFAVATDEDADERESNSSKTKGFEQKINKLNDVRERLQELRGIVSNYETGAQQSVQETINSSKDNRLQAQSMREQQKQANTLTGVGGARLRVQPNANNQDVILNDLMTLQASIEELMDNRNRPMPQGIQRNKIDVTRNAPLKNKNTNQEQKQSNQAVDYAEQLRVLNNARKQFSNLERAAANLKKKNNQRAMENSEVVSEQETDAESTLSALQWQDDPEFQTKVKKLKMAREKLHHLQELVKVVQQGGGPHLPIDDLEDLTLELSEDIEESEYGESEEEGEDTEGDDENEEEELETEEQGSGEDDDQSDISKSTNDINCNFASENGLSDNERRYQGLLRKQRLELNYLLKERERLLQAQRQLSDLAANESEEDEPVQPKKKNSAKKKQKIDYPKLTKAQLRKQQGKSSSKENTMRRLFPKLSSTDAAQGFYAGSEHEIYPAEQAPSDSKAPMLASTTNPMAVSEIRRQRDLFEERKRQKFVEKQRRKKQNRQVQNDENQSEDRATYVINSDIDEGVGVSMYSADVTTAATWGGSTEQSSDEEDSAVGDEEAGVDDDFDQYDQAEEEEEEADSRHPPRGGAAVGNIVQSVLFKDVGDEDEEEPRQKKKNRGIGSVSWSMDVSPPRSRKRPRQGNLTPAHKLIQDNNTKRKQFLKQQQQQQEQQQRKTLPKASPLRPQSTQSNTSAIRQQYRSLSQSSAQPSEDVQSQLATICSSLLRNEQTLLQMLQNQMGQQTVSAEAPCLSSVNARANAGMNQNVLSEIQDFFTSSNYNQSYQETLDALRSTYERIEQHQLDMEFLRQQFEKLNQAPAPSSAAANARAFRSPWPNPPSLHFSAFGGDRTSSAADKPLFQKETQTETSLFGEPFKPSAQQYSLFGESGAEGASAADNQPQDDFPFNPVIVDPTSPGVVGDRAQQKERADDETLTMFPYRLRVSEYNPLSYQGNFANTRTGNTMTISKMSMTKKNEEDSTQNKADEKDGKNIWPSFFKMTDDETGTQASKDATPSKKNGAAAKTASASSSPNKSGKEADESEENATLFEALRDTIYSEVATLIAMNESRPHYLIELFRELQLLNSDYLRQRALYSLQELVTRYLTEENIPPQSSSNVSPSKGTAFTKETLAGQDWIASASEQTPSDLASVVTTTDDEGESQALRTLAQQIQNNEMYDYAELADSQSEANLSTPGSHHDIPFAAEDLGNTVINLEDALQKMRTYEQNMAEAKRAFQEISSNVRESTPSSAANQKEAYETIKRRLNAMDTASTSSAGDVASETSSDAPQPSVDTHKLDQQIKAVMVDLIPFLNENIDKTCNEDFLDLIRRLIVEFAKEKEPGSENEQFGRFFHSQLDSILRDSLMKFNGRKLKECGEDILIDVSEILFNELAFFKLMQDLDRPLFGAVSAEYTSQNQNEHSKMPFAGPTTMYDDSSAAESTDAAGGEQTETDCDDPIESDQGSPVVPKPSNSSATSGGSFVMIDQITDEDEEIEGVESGRHFVKVELSVSETRPFRSSGSGEEDGNEEEPVTFSTAAAPESSINTYSQALQNNIVTAEPVRGEDLDAMVEDDRDEGDQQENARRDVQEDIEGSASGQDDVDADPENERAEDQRDLESSDLAEPESNMALSSGQNESRQEADRHEQTESNRQQQELEEASAEDDLPEADMVSDDNNMNAAEAAHVVLAHMQDQPELAGDGNTLPVPSGQ